MSKRRVVFVCYPDTDYPIGGVKQIYRQVEHLKNAGWETYVLQEQKGFRVSWFENTAPVIDLESYIRSKPNSETDVLVLPETWLKNVPHYFPGIPKIIFNQNAFYTFGLNGDCNQDTLKLYQHQDIHAVVTVSEDNRNMLIKGCGITENRCKVLINGIDNKLFHTPRIKHRRVVFVGRKHADHARKVALMSKSDNVLKDIEFTEITRMEHHEVAEEMKKALIYLSCGHPEGFGLPLAEAIASGCMVVGYHGLGGRDFALPHMKVVEFGDLLGLVEGIKGELERFDRNPKQVIEERVAASKMILKRYSLEEEESCSLRTWSNICP